MAKITATIEHKSGIPLGGIGTGTVEIRPDGYFHDWQICNVGQWTGRGAANLEGKNPRPSPEAFSFYVRVEQKGKPPVMRRLGLRNDPHDLYSLAWLKSVSKIEYDGRFPVATLRYITPDLPVEITGTFYSPFVPHDSRTSGTPGFMADFSVKNRTGEPVTVAILAVLKNFVAWGEEDRKLKNRLTRFDGASCLNFSTDAQGKKSPAIGSMSLSVSGGKHSYTTGEFPTIFATHQSRTAYGILRESIMRDFRNTGTLSNSVPERAPCSIIKLSDRRIDAMTSAQLGKAVRDIKSYAWGGIIAKRLSKVEPKRLETRRGKLEFVKLVRDRFANAKPEGWGDGALASELKVPASGTRAANFTLSWHFPCHISPRGPLLGHMYEKWFKNAQAVNRWLVANRRSISSKVREFTDTLYDSTLPPEFAEAWGGQLTTINKATWWTKDGNFGVWEGLGCCGFHTTDITYQGSFNLLALFPDLQLKQMRMGARFQRKDGRVHHLFRPDLSEVDDQFDRVDMNQQFVMLVCRDYLWTKDIAYLKGLWPNIVKAMDNTERLDKDGDGLPDDDTRRNTYDAWNFFGTPSYVSSLWIGALTAAIRLAEEVGDTNNAAKWRALHELSTKSLDEKLWNGEYYSLWIDGDRRDECCMTDQLSGEWFTSVSGLGFSIPMNRIRKALSTVMKTNYSIDGGLINASYPPGKKPSMSTYDNMQANAPWTGIEYATASLLLECRMGEEAKQIVRSIDRRYKDAGAYWNHVECGGHYYRAMSSWALLLSACGFKVDMASGYLEFLPKIKTGKEFRAPWVSATGWGSFSIKGPSFELECRHGAIKFSSLGLALSGKKARVTVDGRTLKANLSTKTGKTLLSFEREVSVKKGERLTVKVLK